MEPLAFAADAGGLWAFNRPRNFGLNESIAVDRLEDGF